MLYLTKELSDELINHAIKGAPDEVCGILAGKHAHVEKVYQMTNTDKSPESFLMDPGEQLKVMKEIRNLGLEFLAIYHSHPETQAYPSARDVELACYPDVSYLIVSLKDKNDPEIRSFRIQQGNIEEDDLIVSRAAP